MRRQMRYLCWIMFSGLALLQIGCSTMPSANGTAIDSIHKTLEEGAAESSHQSAAPPPEVSAALMPDIGTMLPVPGGNGHEPRFDVSVVNVQARDFFMGLAEGTPYNMVVHPSVQGIISLDLKSVTISDVMNTLQDVYGYEYERKRDGFYVLPIRLRSRIFQVNYLNISRTGRSQTRVSSGQMSNGETGSNNTTADDESSSSSEDSGVLAGSEINTYSEHDFWSELTTALQAIVGSGEGRSVVVTPISGLVVVRAMPMELREVESYLDSTDQAMHRQVILEAKILEVELNDGYQAGINWAKLKSQGGRTISIGQSGGDTPFRNPGIVATNPSSGGIVDPTVTSPVGFTTFQAFGGFFGATIASGSFLAFIELLESQGNVQVLSSPRISTLNNQKAVIKVGTDEFFVTEVSSTTVTGTATATTPDITLTPFFSGIALDVTPQIDEQGGVTLHIHPSVSVVQDQQKEITVGNQQQSLPLALSTVRETDSVVYARNGELVVIGGLMEESTVEDQQATPFVSDIPILGNLFRSTSQSAKKSELVMVLRPIVVNKPSVWGQSMSDSAERFRKLDRKFGFGSKPDVFHTE